MTRWWPSAIARERIGLDRVTRTVTSHLFDLRPGDDELAALLPLLAADEHLQMKQFREQRDQRRFAARRGQLRRLLGRTLDVAPHTLQFDRNAYGKPSLRHGGGLNFNCSSSGDIGLCVVGRDLDLGCDIERTDPAKASPAIANRFFAAGECAILANLPDSEWLDGFFNCWTRKEALLKCLGSGLSTPMDAYEVSLAPGDVVEVRSHDGFVIKSFRPLPGIVAAIIVKSAEPVEIALPLQTLTLAE